LANLLRLEKVSTVGAGGHVEETLGSVCACTRPLPRRPVL